MLVTLNLVFLKSCLKHLKNNAFVIHKIWSDREGNRGGRDYIMHERKKYKAEDERVMNEWNERKVRVAGEEHLAQRSFPISNNKHVALRFM